MTRKMITAALMAAVVLAGCATYGVGFSTMSGEVSADVPNTVSGVDQISGLKQEFSSFYVFGSGKYSEVSAGNLWGTMETSGNQGTIGKLDISGWTFNLYLKYPFYLLNDRLTLFPMIGGDLHGYGLGDSVVGGIMPNLKVGGGLDFTFSEMFFLRGRVGYAPIGITGLTFNIGIGFRTANDEVRERYKTGAEIEAEKARLKAEQLRQSAGSALKSGDWNTAIERYTRIIAENPNEAASYFARSEAYLGTKDYDASARDFNKGAELGKYLPAINGHQVKWRQLYREYREAKGKDAPMNGRAIVIIPGTSHLRFVEAKTPGLTGAQASGTEAALEAGRQAVVFRYNGLLADLTAMNIGDCTMNVELKEGHVYAAVAGFDGRNFIIRIDDITGKETGLDEEEEPDEVTTLTATMFYTNRFKKEMTIGELRQSGFPEAWDSSTDRYYLTSIGSGDKRMTFGALFSGNGLFSYDLVFFSKYKGEITDLLSNACVGPITLDSGGISWLSSEGVIGMKDISNNRTSAIEISIVPFK